MKKIYGDGINLDTEGIQELLDSGTPLVELPVPEKEYIYRVQVGAYSKKSGAEKMLSDLRAAGFGGIIVKSEK